MSEGLPLRRYLPVVVLFAVARFASAEPAGNLTLDPFRPAIDSRGYLTVNASQVLGDKELSFGLGALDYGHNLLHFESSTCNRPGTCTYDIHNMVTATLIAAFGIHAGPAELEFGASVPFVVMDGDRNPDDLGDP